MFDNVFEALVKRSQEQITPEAGDYVIDGLLYCHKCNTPKQCRIEVFGKEMKPMCLCKCEQERIEAEKAAAAERAFDERVKNLRKMGFPSSDMEGWVFDRDDGENPKIATICRKYVENWQTMKKDGKGLLFYGDVGTGKTFFASCIANALIDKGIPCLVTNFSRLINTVSGMYDGKQDYIDGLNRFQLLVIDDLAAERDTEYASEIVYSVIDARYRAGLPLIVTTNLTNEQLKHPDTEAKNRVFSRLFEMCLPFAVTGKDRRKAKLRQDYADYKALLGVED